MRIGESVKRWFNERFDTRQIQGVFEKQLLKPLPKHVNWFYTLGSMAFFLFVSQMITGVLLLLYYRPTVKEAFDSIKYIMTVPYMGWLYRQLHAWGGNLMIIIVFIHMIRTFVVASYKRPRELTWISGVFLLFLTMTFGFTGYLLPWNQLSYWATTVGTEIAGAVPFIGDILKFIMRGGDSVGSETLARFFVVHVIVLPWIVFFLIVSHLFLVRYHGITPIVPVGFDETIKEGEGIPFYPRHLLKEAIVFFFLLGVLMTLSILYPFELGEKADPLTTPEAIKPEWYFLPMYQLLKYMSKTTGILLIVIIAPIVMIFWPFFDRSKARNPFRRPISMGIAIFVLIATLALGVLGYLSETKRSFFGVTYEFDIYGVPKVVSSEQTEKTLSEETQSRDE